MWSRRGGPISAHWPSSARAGPLSMMPARTSTAVHRGATCGPAACPGRSSSVNMNPPCPHPGPSGANCMHDPRRIRPFARPPAMIICPRRPSGEIGRRAGLKIRWGSNPVPVRPRPRAPSLPSPGDLAMTPATAPAWIETSNRHAAIVLDWLARFHPEVGSLFGVPGSDERVFDLGPRIHERRLEAAQAVATALEALAPKETDAAVRQDLAIMLDAVRRDVDRETRHHAAFL